jgi:BASS family bile acid:Na+ symporter
VCFVFVTFFAANNAVAEEDTESDESNVIIDVVLPVALAFIMFSLGIGLTIDDFSIITKEPKVFAIGIANQMIVLPIVAFVIATGLGLSAELSVGLMILACSPGGVTSNILTKLAKGDTALSVSYTAIVSMATVVTLPIIVGLSMDHFMDESAPDIDVLTLGITMFLLTTVPVVIGMSVRHYSIETADKIDKGVSMVAAGLFVIIVLAAIATEWNTLMDNIGALGPAVVILSVMMLGIGYKSAEFLELNAKRATTVSIESGIQNASVGITVGGLILASPDGGLSTLSLPSGVYGVLMYIVVAPFVYWRINQTED